MMEILNDLSLFVTLALFAGLNCSSVLKSNGTAGKDLNAQTLIALGRELNDSLITVIGKVIENYHNCTWSQWTECGARRPNFFSTRTRTGHCGNDKLGTGRHAETVTEVCEGKILCPSDYNTTENGFCLKLYTTEKTHDEAKSVCTNDGGFLINIDSGPKYADVKAFLTASVTRENIHIDGRRRNSQWEYTHGSTSGYFHWYSGYPKSDANCLCLGLTGYRTITSQRFLTFNEQCSIVRQYLCEIPV